jgi:hypothetical protein
MPSGPTTSLVQPPGFSEDICEAGMQWTLRRAWFPDDVVVPLTTITGAFAAHTDVEQVRT